MAKITRLMKQRPNPYFLRGGKVVGFGLGFIIYKQHHLYYFVEQPRKGGYKLAENHNVYPLVYRWSQRTGWLVRGSALSKSDPPPLVNRPSSGKSKVWDIMQATIMVWDDYNKYTGKHLRAKRWRDDNPLPHVYAV